MQERKGLQVTVEREEIVYGAWELSGRVTDSAGAAVAYWRVTFGNVAQEHARMTVRVRVETRNDIREHSYQGRAAVRQFVLETLEGMQV